MLTKINVWPRWLRVAFTVSSVLFIAAVGLILLTPLSTGIIQTPFDVLMAQVNDIATKLAAISGPLGVLLGLYAQWISVRKAKAEKTKTDLEIARLKLELQQKQAAPKKTRKPSVRKKKTS
jgi:hypothetical protein